MTRQSWLLALFLVLPACGDDDGGGAADGGTQPRVDGAPGSCTTSEQCPNGICDPSTHVCVTSLACTSHASCGLAAYCDEDGQCQPAGTGTPCDTADNCATDYDCTGGFCGCGGTAYNATNVPANLLIVLDRSVSMSEQIGGVSKWEIAKTAINDLLASSGSSIHFGLALYPAEELDCGTYDACTDAGAVFVDPAADGTGAGATAVAETLAEASQCSGTPTGEMLTELASYAGLDDTTRANYILLITDGESNCPTTPGDVAATLLAQSPSIKTFAVGFGEGVDPSELNDIAQQGGTAIAGGPPYYYVADDASSLQAALSTIGGSVMSCTYSLSDVPPDLDELYVFQDGESISRDTAHADGWDYDAATNQVTFYGPACDALIAGTVSDLAIVYGCPNYVP